MSAADVDMQVMQDLATGAVNFQGTDDRSLILPRGFTRRQFLIDRAHADPVFLVNGLNLEHVRWWDAEVHLPYENGCWVAFTVDMERTPEILKTLPDLVQREARPRPQATLEYAVHLREQNTSTEQRFFGDFAYFDPIDPLGAQTMLGVAHLEVYQRDAGWKVDWEVNVNHEKAASRSKQDAVMLNQLFVEDAQLRLQVALNAMSVLANRKVTTVPAVVPRRWATKAVRKPSHRVDYRLLVLPDGTKTNGYRSYGHGTSETALHTVRGHFATYSADAPLFGRTTGAVWRRSHIRGSKSVGTITKDYELREN